MNDLKEHLADCVPSKQFVFAKSLFPHRMFSSGIMVGTMMVILLRSMALSSVIQRLSTPAKARTHLVLLVTAQF